jgi:hypothetical protein
MSKKINTDDLANELAAGSLFFGKNARPVTSGSDETEGTAVTPLTPRSERPNARTRASTVASTSDSTRASTQANNPDRAPAITSASEQARKQASTADSTPADSLASTLASRGDLADAIYRVVKKTGKHVAYVRTTEREKSELTVVLDGIAETHGYKVTETELIRIAICGALADYAQNGIDSLLMRVILALRD